MLNGEFTQILNLCNQQRLIMIDKSKKSNSTKFKTFYFKFPHKLQMIPYVEEEIKGYIQNHEPKIKDMDQQSCKMLAKAIQVKIKKIQQFYDENYIDYRAHMILRSKHLLHQFLIRNSQYLIIITEEKNIAQRGSSIEVTSTINNTRSRQTPKIRKITDKNSNSKSRKINLNGKRIQTSTSRNSKIQNLSAKKQQIKPKNTKIRIITSPNIQQQSQIDHKITQKKFATTTRGRHVAVNILNHNVDPEKKMTKQQYIQHLKMKKK